MIITIFYYTHAPTLCLVGCLTYSIEQIVINDLLFDARKEEVYYVDNVIFLPVNVITAFEIGS